jgi:single-strand DNA-binding protein
MASCNKVLLLGNLTRDVQLSYTPNQTAVADFGLAVNRKWAGSDGSKKEAVCFIDVRAFGRQAENVNKYCKKGDSVFVDGFLEFESWKGKDGGKHSKHRVTASNVQFMGGKGKPGRDAVDETPGPDQDIPF